MALVHCRGGVGRAGVIACCWALKLGLCGWIETDVAADAPTNAAVEAHLEKLRGRKAAPLAIRHDTLRLVERAINLTRRRRSMKAVETYEQVRFLVDYVEFLRQKGQRMYPS